MVSQKYKIYWPSIGPIISTYNKYENYKFSATCDSKPDIATAYLLLFDNNGTYIKGFITTKNYNRYNTADTCFFTALFDIKIELPETGDKSLKYIMFFAKSEYKRTDEFIEYITRKASKRLNSFQLENFYTDTESFVVGSCNLSFWLGNLRLFSASDLFSQILRKNPDFVLLIGDNLYADVMNRFKQPKTVHNYLDLYKKQFGIPHIKELLANKPIYTIFDDHEVYNDFSDDIVTGTNTDIISNGMYSYKLFQGLSNPFTNDNYYDYIKYSKIENWRFTNRVKNHYTFEKQFGSFFVMDVRTGRSEAHEITYEQLTDLLTWLHDVPDNRPKFIVSSIPMFPGNEVPKDIWTGATYDTVYIFNFIFRLRINNVFILCGDLHYSMVSELYKKGDELAPTFGNSFDVDTFIKEKRYVPNEKYGDSPSDYKFKVVSICTSPFKCFRYGKYGVPSNQVLPIPNGTDKSSDNYFYVDNTDGAVRKNTIMKECYCKIVIGGTNVFAEYFDNKDTLLKGYNFDLIC